MNIYKSNYNDDEEIILTSRNLNADATCNDPKRYLKGKSY